MDDGERKSRYRKYPLTTQLCKASTNDTIPYIKYLLVDCNGGDNEQVYVDICGIYIESAPIMAIRPTKERRLYLILTTKTCTTIDSLCSVFGQPWRPFSWKYAILPRPFTVCDASQKSYRFKWRVFLSVDVGGTHLPETHYTHKAHSGVITSDRKLKVQKRDWVWYIFPCVLYV